MSPEITQKVKDFVDGFKVLDIKVFDYPSLTQAIMMLELKKLIVFINSALEQPEVFEYIFKRSCRKRLSYNQNNIPIQDKFDSIANKLYWGIAKIVFQPKTLDALLGILVPEVTSYLKVSCPTHFPRGNMTWREQSLFSKSYEPVIEVIELEQLELAPNHEDFTHYIIGNNILLDTRQIVNFPLRSHAKLKRYLDTLYPELAVKLYQHNDYFQKLSLDIHTLESKGLSPRYAIEQLIEKLKQGSTVVTGVTVASRIATVYAAWFLDYVKTLSKPILDELNKLQTDKLKTFASITIDLIHGECVRGASVDLQSILDVNKTNPILDVIPLMDFAHLKKIEQNYLYSFSRTVSILDSKQDQNSLSKLPKKLRIEVINSMHVNSLNHVINLIINFDPKWYCDLFVFNVGIRQLLYKKEFRKKLVECINSGIFIDEQLVALAKALDEACAEIDWFFDTNNIHFVDFAFEKLLKSSGASLFTTIKSKNILAKVASNPNALKKVFDKLSKDEIRLILAEDPDWTAFRNACLNLQSLNMFLSLYSDTEIVKIVTRRQAKGYSLLYFSIKNHQTLERILSLIPDDIKLQEIEYTFTEDNQKLLHCAVLHNPSLEVILKAYATDEQGLRALQAFDSQGRTALHYVQSKESAVTILAYYPDNSGLQAILKEDVYGNSVLHYSVFYVEALEYLLSQFTPDRQSELAKIKNLKRRTLLHKAVDNFFSYRVVIGLYAVDERLQAVLQEDSLGNNALFYTRDLDVLTMLVELIPVQDRYNNYIRANNKRESILIRFFAYPVFAARLIELLPRDQVFCALKYLVNTKPDVFEKTFKDNMFAEKIYQYFPVSMRNNEIILELLKEKSKPYKDLEGRRSRGPKTMKFYMYCTILWSKINKYYQEVTVSNDSEATIAKKMDQLLHEVNGGVWGYMDTIIFQEYFPQMNPLNCACFGLVLALIVKAIMPQSENLERRFTP